jgi:hypothetical protein
VSMSMHDEVPAKRMWSGEEDAGLQNLCAGLTRTGRLYLEKIAAAINEVAPGPGAIVYVTARKLSIPLNGLDPVLFSAIDATTHLQVAQAYLSMTSAAAFSFIEFAAKCFPFPISQIRTPAQRPFKQSAASFMSHDFSAFIGHLGYVHSVMDDISQDALYGITSRLRFGGIEEGSLACGSTQDLQRELGKFLFFHNNYRSIPWLEGKTPVQKLKTFEGYGGVHTFSSFDAKEENHPASKNDSARRGVLNDRTAPRQGFHN